MYNVWTSKIYYCVYHIFMMQSMNAKGSKNYPNAKQYGRNALILTIFNIFFTLMIALVFTAFFLGFVCAHPSSYYSKFITVIVCVLCMKSCIFLKH